MPPERPDEDGTVQLSARAGRSAPFLVAAALALALRLWYVLATRHDGTFGFDSSSYFYLANSLVHSHRYLSPYEPGHPESALFPPGVPIILAALHAVQITSLRRAAIAFSVLGVGTVLVIVHLGRRLFDLRTAWIAGVLAAAYPMLIMADGAVMTEGVYALLVVSTIALCVRAQRLDSRWAWCLVGAPIAAATITRSDGVLLLPFVAWLAALLVPGDWRRRLLRCAVATLLPCVVAGAWIIRNDVQLGYPVPIAVNSWAVIGGANCHATYYGTPLGGWDYNCLDVPRHDRLGQHEVDGNLAIRDDGLHYIRTHLSRTPYIALARLGRTFGAMHPIDELRAEANFESRSYGLSLWGYGMYLGVIPFAAFGAWRAWRRNRTTVILLLGPLAAVIVNTVVGYGNQRFRIAFEPSLVLLAAYGIGVLMTGFRVRSRQ